MKSSLSGSALAVLALVCLTGTASAQYSLYSPTMLPASQHSETTAYHPNGAYSSASPVPVAAGPFRRPAVYSVYNNNLSDILGTPPPSTYLGGPAQPAPGHHMPGQYMPGQHMVTQPMPPAYGAAPIGSGAYGCGGCGSCSGCTTRVTRLRTGNWFGSVSALLMKPDRQIRTFSATIAITKRTS